MIPEHEPGRGASESLQERLIGLALIVGGMVAFSGVYLPPKADPRVMTVLRRHH